MPVSSANRALPIIRGVLIQKALVGPTVLSINSFILSASSAGLLPPSINANTSITQSEDATIIHLNYRLAYIVRFYPHYMPSPEPQAIELRVFGQHYVVIISSWLL